MRDLAPLIAALEEEHCDQCSADNSCDINVAFEDGYYLWAAHLLIGATECPKTEAAYVALDVTNEELEAERVELLRLNRHVHCAKCNALCWNVERDDTCGSCGHSFHDNNFFVEMSDDEPEEEEEEPPVNNWAKVAGTQHPDEEYAAGVPTLRRSATHAQAFLEAYARITGLDPEADRDAMISDFLSDMMHFCDMTGQDFNQLLQRADRNYEAEINGEA